MEKLYEILKRQTESGSLKKLVFSSSDDKSIIKISARPVSMKGEVYYQFETFTADGKALHKNVPSDEAAEYARGLFRKFRRINLICSGGTCEFMVSKGGKITLINRIKGADAVIPGAHNKEKNTVLRDGVYYPFLEKLGISDSSGRIFDRRRAKFTQINRFLDIIDGVYSILPREGRLSVCDLCCGKSYLTFAAYYFLTKIKGREVDMYAIDLKSDVIDECREAAAAVGFDGMHFECGNISDFILERTDMIISLHACDTATDIVLANAVRMNAQIILSTPCCHHEMAGQIDCPELAFITEHSMLRQKLCDAATDSLRALMLEACGYRVTAIELTDPENTPKNILLRAVRHKIDEQKRTALLSEYRRACTFLGVKPCLAKLLGIDIQ